MSSSAAAMPIVSFAAAIARHVEAPTVTVSGATLREALDAALVGRPRLRAYLLDEQGMLRRHVALYVNGRLARDRAGLGDPLGPGDEIHVFQALSGG